MPQRKQKSNSLAASQLLRQEKGTPSPAPYPRKRRFAHPGENGAAVQILCWIFCGLTNYKAISLIYLCPLGFFAHWDSVKALYALTVLKWQLHVFQQDAAIYPPGTAFAKPGSMNFGSTSDAVATIEGLRQEINSLTQQHFNALKSARLGITPGEAEADEARLKTIRELAEELWRQRVSIGNFNV